MLGQVGVAARGLDVEERKGVKHSQHSQDASGPPRTIQRRNRQLVGAGARPRHPFEERSTVPEVRSGLGEGALRRARGVENAGAGNIESVPGVVERGGFRADLRVPQWRFEALDSQEGRGRIDEGGSAPCGALNRPNHDANIHAASPGFGGDAVSPRSHTPARLPSLRASGPRRAPRRDSRHRAVDSSP